MWYGIDWLSTPCPSGQENVVPAFQTLKQPVQAVERLQSRLMLYARQAKSHSMRTLAMPRSRNCRSPIALLMMPKTGSTLSKRACHRCACPLQLVTFSRMAINRGSTTFLAGFFLGGR